jgi:hypothetical protein
MLYYDDRDFYNSDNIDELYENDEVSDIHNEYEENIHTAWEYDYQNIASELVDD